MLQFAWGRVQGAAVFSALGGAYGLIAGRAGREASAIALLAARDGCTKTLA